MVKRKSHTKNGRDRQQLPEESSSSDEDTNMLDVEFEWFDPQPDHDFQGLKTLIRQLLDVDSQLFDLSAMTNLILAQPLLGSTVKVDGNETDPYAFLTVLNLNEHKDKPVIKGIITYVLQQAKANASLSAISDLLATTNTAQIGLILTERLVNIPSEVVPPMYKMLLEEVSWAVAEKEPYTFTHYLIWSKTYQEIASLLDQEGSRPSKKKKHANIAGSKAELETFYFHPEDEVLQRHSSVFGGFDYLKSEAEGHSDSKRTFQELGIKPKGYMMLIETAKFPAAVDALEQYLSPT